MHHQKMKFPSRNPSCFPSSTTVIILLFLIMFITSDQLDASMNQQLERNDTANLRSVPAIFVFGDSIVDPGNNNHIKTLVKCNFPPYGRDFKGGNPTGRCSNGFVPSDLLAEGFGVKEIVPAYLDPNLQPQDLITGVSFASGASGYDPLTSKITSTISMTEQLDLFKQSLTKIKAAVGEEQTAYILSKSIFLVCSGSDDIANTYYGTPFRWLDYDINSYTDLMSDAASSFLQELYGVGARRIAVKFPDSKIVFLDAYTPLLSLFQNPANYGFEVGTKGCCGTGNIEVSLLCTQLSNSKTCKDDTKYIFWDSYHPTEAAYKVLVTELLSKYKNCIF
ncbi:hypothetical protein Q3G72_026687 [Acer saccharum]|nr:hypothetical protein Q3G72_026687 [Acer saccharum]